MTATQGLIQKLMMELDDTVVPFVKKHWPSASEIPEDVAKYGQPLEGYHYSKNTDPLRRLSAFKYGTGAKGQESLRLLAEPDIAPRTFFYPDVPEGSQSLTPRPESVVGGGPTYMVKEGGMYDMIANPLGFDRSDLNKFERQVRDAGFTGYFNKNFGQTGGAVVLRPSTEAAMVAPNRIEAEKSLQRAQNLPDRPFIVTAENIPSTETEFGQWLASQGIGTKERYTDEIEGLLDRIGFMNEMGVKDYAVRPGYGSYMGEINPNTVIQVPDEQAAQRVAQARGLITMQDAVPYYQVNPEGGVTGVRVMTDRSITPEMMAQAYEDTGLDFTRSNLNTIDIMNFAGDDGVPFSGMSDKDFTNFLEGYFSEKAGVTSVSPFKAASDYNSTQELWQANQGARLLEAMPNLRGLSERIKAHNDAFRKQHGFADPRVLALLSALGSGGMMFKDKAGDK